MPVRIELRAIVVAASIAALIPLVACGERCASAAACPAPVTYDLVVTEADSGRLGILNDQKGVAFFLDGGHDRFAISPSVAYHRIQDPVGQFKNGFAIDGMKEGMFDVTGTGADLTPFTFHLIVGTPILIGLNFVHLGDLIVQEFDNGPPPTSADLSRPTFELVQDAVTVGTSGRLLSLKTASTRRVYRARQLGAQTIGYRGEVDRVIVADPPKSLVAYIDASGPASQVGPIKVGDRFLVVIMGDIQLVSWSVHPVDGVMRLPDADRGPQSPGALLIPFRLILDGKVILELRAGSIRTSVLINPDPTSCLPDDFPRYPLAATTSATSVNEPCVVGMESKDSQRQIVAFYQLRLTEGDWRVVSVNGSTVAFSRNSNSAIRGAVEAPRGGGMQIRIT